MTKSPEPSLPSPSPALITWSANGRAPGQAPLLPIAHVDTLWLQVTGTLCNLACRHCFISCGPKNQNHPMMSVASVEEALWWGENHGVREYYFTGGEPFMHPAIGELIDVTLAKGPLNILTNGMLIDEAMARRLGQRARESRYSLDLRVSLDGTTPQENDPIRGRHTFEKILAGALRLWHHGINPVITVTTCDAGLAGEAGRARFVELLVSRGIARPRLKFLAPFKIGREARRDEGYRPDEVLREEEMAPGYEDALQCSSCRMVTAKGVYPCPILIEVEGARMGSHLDEAMAPIRLDHPACRTCYVEGVSCRT